MNHSTTAVQHADMDIITTRNPATGDALKQYPEFSPDEAASIVDKSHKAFGDWRKTSFAHRAALMVKAAALLKEQKNTLGALMSAEMGKVHKEAVAEIEKCAWVCEYYAQKAETFLADEEVQTDLHHSFISYQPIGVVLAVMPWNFPFWQVLRFAAPNLMAGNGAVLKHASSVTGCALAIENIFIKAGFPENLFRTLVIGSKKVEAIIAHEHIRAVTLTGSTQAGRAVGEAAGRGSDPYIILADADLPKAAEICATSRLLNAGQSCIAAKRFIVVEAVYDDFIIELSAVFAKKKMGDPSDESNDLGPQANEALRDELHDQVLKSIAQGATCITGGEIPDKAGAWYPPTILSDVRAPMPAYNEELFGPVAAVIKVKDTQEAINVANASEFGLGGAVFTQDLAKGQDIARNMIESGAVFVNSQVKSDPRLPFGGIKNSGYGRELSRFGIHEFVNIKTIGVAT